MDGAPPPPGPAQLVCSARGCRETAAWALVWRNPRLHAPDRRKTWLACPGHRESLTSFLAARGFPLEVEPAPGATGADGEA